MASGEDMNAEREKEKGNHTGTTERQFGKGSLNCKKPRARQTLTHTVAHARNFQRSGQAPDVP